MTNTAIALGLAFMVVFCASPILWMVLTSFKTRVMLYDPSIWLFKPVLANYISTLTRYGIGANLRNSIIISFGNLIPSLVIGTLAAYGIVRVRSKFAQGFSLVVLILRMLPPISLAVAYYVAGFLAKMLDTHLLMILAHMSFTLPLVIWMMQGYLRRVPKQIEEAALLDGCTRVRALYRIVLPVVTPGLFATGVFAFLFSWNEFAYAFFLTSINSKTVPMAVAFFRTERGVLWGEVSALGVIAIFPAIVLVVLAHRILIKGFTFGIGE